MDNHRLLKRCTRTVQIPEWCLVYWAKCQAAASANTAATIIIIIICLCVRDTHVHALIGHCAHQNAIAAGFWHLSVSVVLACCALDCTL